ncbi:alpha/beta fold hydrolase [Paenibacillus radicis (ex Xue et al. 2023)]|uniref:Alpha/beta hydrolase n=1 Tax=Paenibacillus radicis (ex Xue et al. 2023) TaxID=2972489 RepID=A0ABT1YUS8_9BACL|nr:alpha/beta hydrolase [Paenibacillus radicis (ex Xue et al. 2023)]MCR8636644.1 alpha/beta hydrolase [Paenibacillus radicis (ex Xue et al. 2023)]
MYSVTSKDGTKIAYDKVGKGRAIILVAGAFSYRKFPGQVQLANLLAEHFMVYNYDRRGRGDSGDTKPYDTAREIEDLTAMIDEAGGSAYVWGLSSGAVLALQAAAKGANITKLVLHEPPFVVNAADRKPPEDFVLHVKELIEVNRRAEAIKYFMTKGMGAPSIIVSLMRMMPGVWANLMAVAHTLPYDAALLDGFLEGKPLPAKLWSTVTVPTLVLEGTESPTALRHGAQALANVLPNAQLLSKKGLGHTKKLDAKRISAELAAFFMSNP